MVIFHDNSLIFVICGDFSRYLKEAHRKVMIENLQASLKVGSNKAYCCHFIFQSGRKNIDIRNTRKLSLLRITDYVFSQ